MGSSASKARRQANADAHSAAVAKFEANVPCTRVCSVPVAPTCDKTFGTTIKEFLLQGNAFDIAVGLMVAAALAKIVTSLINDLLMPAILCPIGAFSLRDQFIVCPKRKYKDIKALEAAGVVDPGEYADLDAAAAAGVNVYIQVDSLDKAQEAGLNTINWGNFVQILFNFVVIIIVVATLVFAISRARCAFAAKK